MNIKIKTNEIRQLMEIESPEFPKYTTQILNLANQNSQATRSNIVGQMSDLIQNFEGSTLNEWEEWYIERYPDSIDKATEKILSMIDNFKDALNKIDENMIKEWVKDLVIVKTFIGLRFQEAVLKKIAEEFNLDYELSTAEEESKGIDGYIGDVPISLKPTTYDSKKGLMEKIEVSIIYYEKQKDGLKIEISEELEKKLRDISENNNSNNN